uniref:Uncharacterized protein n=1 Tax=Zea mays TaxID=4577 RepID=C0PLT3_MAIZE|nr:unknown [Zea mays]
MVPSEQRQSVPHLHRFTGTAPSTSLVRPPRSPSLAACTRRATSTRCGTTRPLSGGCSSTRHGFSRRACLSSLARRMSTFIGVTYGFRSHFLPARGTSTYGTAASSSSEATVRPLPCSHLARAVSCRGRRTRSDALDRTPRFPCICQTCAAALGLKRHSVKHLTSVIGHWGEHAHANVQQRSAVARKGRGRRGRAQAARRGRDSRWRAQLNSASCQQ